ncbi:MAG TPA: acyl-CoA reductase, partial [Chitinophagaceae bacterium]|nr:acyl-CoA reductase [Chitinophagaceae bacterium]
MTVISSSILNERIGAFAQLGTTILSGSDEMEKAIAKARAENPWFTDDFCRLAMLNIARHLLDEQKLTDWAKIITAALSPKTIAVVAAGNIPLVSFNDILCVLASGNKLLLKTSEKDSALTRFVLGELIKSLPGLENYISISGTLKDFDAVIATGSNNTSRYFDYYFKDYPRIIKRNRTSLAILDGSETKAELSGLAHDIFDYFGLGCRNVSHLLVPDGYDFTPLAEELRAFGHIADHHKYRNNLDYRRTIYLMNQIPFLNIDHINMTENEALFSPISCLHYHFYKTEYDTHRYAVEHKDDLQCVVGRSGVCNVGFGETQKPGLTDY